MHTIIASLPEPATYQAVGWGLVMLASLAAGLNQALKLMDRFKDKPAPGEVRSEAVDRFTSKVEFREHVSRNEREHESIFSRLGGIERGARDRMDAISKEWRGFVDAKFTELVESNNAGRENLHKRVNQILEQVSELRGEIRANKKG